MTPEHNACGTPDCCGGCPTSRLSGATFELFLWLQTKPKPRLRMEQACCEAGCMRPAWLLGRCSAHYRLARLLALPMEWC
jgi:hypothetical protein